MAILVTPTEQPGPKPAPKLMIHKTAGIIIAVRDENLYTVMYNPANPTMTFQQRDDFVGFARDYEDYVGPLTIENAPH